MTLQEFFYFNFPPLESSASKIPGEENALPVFFFLDEFGNMGHINNFASIATTLRKRRCSINIILQELSQFKAIYGLHEAQSIYSGGMRNKLFFSGLDLETCTYLERVLGQNTEYDTVFGGVDDKARTVGRPLLSADEIRMMDEREGILISGRQRPVRMKMPAYFRESRLQAMTEKEPAEIQLDYANETVEYLEIRG